MRNVLDFGQQGAERLGSYTGPKALATDSLELTKLLAVVKKFQSQTIEADTSNGVQESVSVRTLLLSNPRVFGLVRRLAAFEPMAYAQQGNRTELGMLSPNYDPQGEYPLPSIKFIPLLTPYPLTSGHKPDARQASMLAGAVNAEGKGVGGHSGNTAEDFEHKATILGAASLNNPAIALQDRNHVVRQASSVATGLSNGQLGQLYVPDRSLNDFTGYGMPMIFDERTVGAGDAIFLPDSFIDNEEGFAAFYVDAPRIMLGAGLEALVQRRGMSVLEDINSIGAAVNQELVTR